MCRSVGLRTPRRGVPRMNRASRRQLGLRSNCAIAAFHAAERDLCEGRHLLEPSGETNVLPRRGRGTTRQRGGGFSDPPISTSESVISRSIQQKDQQFRLLALVLVLRNSLLPSSPLFSLSYFTCLPPPEAQSAALPRPDTSKARAYQQLLPALLFPTPDAKPSSTSQR